MCLEQVNERRCKDCYNHIHGWFVYTDCSKKPKSGNREKCKNYMKSKFYHAGLCASCEEERDKKKISLTLPGPYSPALGE